MREYKPPPRCRNPKYWEQRVLNANVAGKSSHLSNCGIGGIYSFAGTTVNLKETVERGRRLYKDYMDWYKNAADVRSQLGAPRHVENIDDYEQWLRETKGGEPLGKACRRIASDLLKWLGNSAYHQVVFSGCVSEYLPRSKGSGAYHKGFHAGRFAAYISLHPELGRIYAGPVTLNTNHASYVQAFVWVPPKTLDLKRGWTSQVNFNRDKAIK